VQAECGRRNERGENDTLDKKVKNVGEERS
jgi:hypothetical protein